MICSTRAGTISATPMATPASPTLSGQPQLAVFDIYLATTRFDIPIATARRRESPKTTVASPARKTIPPRVLITPPMPKDSSSRIQPSATSTIPIATATGPSRSVHRDSRSDASISAILIFIGCMCVLPSRSSGPTTLLDSDDTRLPRRLQQRGLGRPLIHECGGIWLERRVRARAETGCKDCLGVGRFMTRDFVCDILDSRSSFMARPDVPPCPSWISLS